MLFGLFPQFRLESTGPMRFLTGCLTKTLDIGTSLLQYLSFFVHLRVDHSRLRKAVIRVQTERQEKIFDHILLSRPAMDVGLSECDRIYLLSRRHNRNQFGFRRHGRGRGRLPSGLPPGDLFVSDVGPPAAWKALFRTRAGHRSAQVTDQRHREPERFIVAIRARQQKPSGSDLTLQCAMTTTVRGTN